MIPSLQTGHPVKSGRARTKLNPGQSWQHIFIMFVPFLSWDTWFGVGLSEHLERLNISTYDSEFEQSKSHGALLH